MKYINKRLNVTVGFSEGNAKKTEADFIKANAHLGFSNEELKEAYSFLKQPESLAKKSDDKTSVSKNP